MSGEYYGQNMRHRANVFLGFSEAPRQPGCDSSRQSVGSTDKNGPYHQGRSRMDLAEDEKLRNGVKNDSHRHQIADRLQPASQQFLSMLSIEQHADHVSRP